MYATATSEQAEVRPGLSRGIVLAACLLTSMVPAMVCRAAVDTAAGVDVQIVARPAGAQAGQDFRLHDGGVLRTGDGVQLRLKSETQAYVYVIAYGSSHSAILLHPFSGRAKDARMAPGAAEIIPGRDVFLPLDAHEGHEALFTIVSQTPLEDIRGLLARIERQGDNMAAITDLIQERYKDVRPLTFRHIGMRPLVGVAATAPRRASAGPSLDSAGASAPSAAGDTWSVPSASESFESSAPPAAPAAPAGAVEAASAPAERSVPAGGSAAAPDASAARASEEVSPALRKARQAAGIDEAQFRGILATLPASGSGHVPDVLAKRDKETGVLSAEGSRIPALQGVQVDSGPALPAASGSAAGTKN